MREPAGRWECAIWSANHRFAPDTDLEEARKREKNKEERTLEEGVRGGHGLKTNVSAREARVTLLSEH